MTEKKRARGLTTLQAQKLLAEHGHNVIDEEKKVQPLKILFEQFANWLIVMLLVAAVISFFLGEIVETVVIVLLVVLSALLGFFQEYQAEKSLQELRKLVAFKSRVLRDGVWQTIASKKLVIGDVVKLRIGDLIPADVEMIEIDGLSANESTLTGESAPVEKKVEDIVFMGTSVASGLGMGIVAAVGKATKLGELSKDLERKAPQTEFQKQTKNFSKLIFQMTAAMTIFVFIASSATGKGFFDSFFFAVALAVGMAPELLPAIVTITLSHGARAMVAKKVIVKRLIAVENLGNVDTLCSDKTGTLTRGSFALIGYRSLHVADDESLLMRSLMCSDNFINQSSDALATPVDEALWQAPSSKKHQSHLKTYKKLDQNEFDYDRRRMSVLVTNRKEKILVVKGAPTSILSCCVLLKDENRIVKLTDKLTKEIKNLISEYEKKGVRVIAVAERNFHLDKTSASDEKDLTFLGFLLFEDPVKASAKEAIAQLRALGVRIKIISGDSAPVTHAIANQAGIAVGVSEVIHGDVLAKLNTKEFEQYAMKYDVFARITPSQKYQIVMALNKQKHVVAFLGDGVNDAPALKAADVGISVDTGAQISKEAADIILLKKDLKFLADGIVEGRKTFGNIMKYIFNTISANNGNMLTVTLASAFLKFIPMLPSQILLNNFISDIPLLAVATDKVDPHFTTKPKRWNMKKIWIFMMVFGLLSTFFDLFLLLPMLFFWKVSPEVFRTSWFVMSSLSEILITFSIRTKLIFFKSVPSWMLILLSILSSLMIVGLPLIGIGQKMFEFVSIPREIWLWIGLGLVLYFICAELLKRVFYRYFEE